jgi:hypothetical protein
VPSNKKVFLAIPAGCGSIKCLTVKSVIANLRTLDAAGWSAEYCDVPGDPYVCQARNKLVKKFLESDCMDMVFIDSDVGFPDDAILRLLQHDVQVVGAAYPYKSDKGGYPVSINTNPSRQAAYNPQTGLIYAVSLPTGLLRINRTVFNTLMEKKPELYYDVGEDERMWSFFQTGDLFGDHKFWGEDTAFCRRLKEIYIQAWLEPRLDMRHCGDKTWEGNYHEMLLKQPLECDAITEITNRMQKAVDEGVISTQWLGTCDSMPPSEKPVGWCWDCTPEEDAARMRDYADKHPVPNRTIVPKPALLDPMITEGKLA